jgi:hypothetical protein
MAKYAHGVQSSVKIIKFSRIDFYFSQQYIMSFFDFSGIMNWLQSTKDAVVDTAGKFTGASTTVAVTETNTTGGRKSRNKSRSMSRKILKGGYTDNIAVSGLAANAAPFSGETAKPQTMVGGKSRRRKTGGKKTRRH